MKRLKKLSAFTQLETGFYRNDSNGDYVLDPSARQCLLIQSQLYDSLKPHHLEALQWLWGLHKREEGGILGDDMGLGKNLQIASFLGSLYYSKLTNLVLIIVPKNLVTQWQTDCKSSYPKDVLIKEFHGAKAKREKELEKLRSVGTGTCITTYDTLRSNTDLLNGCAWDYIVLDEAHKIRNHTTKTAISVSEVKGRHKILLTGTPIMNDLRELWALFYYISDERILGDMKKFVEDYEKPILAATHKKATTLQKKTSEKVAKQLREAIEPYFLRREMPAINTLEEPAVSDSLLPIDGDNDSTSVEAVIPSPNVSETTTPTTSASSPNSGNEDATIEAQLPPVVPVVNSLPLPPPIMVNNNDSNTDFASESENSASRDSLPELQFLPPPVFDLATLRAIDVVAYSMNLCFSPSKLPPPLHYTTSPLTSPKSEASAPMSDGESLLLASPMRTANSLFTRSPIQQQRQVASNVKSPSHHKSVSVHNTPSRFSNAESEKENEKVAFSPTKQPLAAKSQHSTPTTIVAKSDPHSASASPQRVLMKEFANAKSVILFDDDEEELDEAATENSTESLASDHNNEEIPQADLDDNQSEPLPQLGDEESEVEQVQSNDVENARFEEQQPNGDVLVRGDGCEDECVRAQEASVKLMHIISPHKRALRLDDDLLDNESADGYDGIKAYIPRTSHETPERKREYQFVQAILSPSTPSKQSMQSPKQQARKKNADLDLDLDSPLSEKKKRFNRLKKKNPTANEPRKPFSITDSPTTIATPPKSHAKSVEKRAKKAREQKNEKKQKAREEDSLDDELDQLLGDDANHAECDGIDNNTAVIDENRDEVDSGGESEQSESEDALDSDEEEEEEESSQDGSELDSEVEAEESSDEREKRKPHNNNKMNRHARAGPVVVDFEEQSEREYRAKKARRHSWLAEFVEDEAEDASQCEEADSDETSGGECENDEDGLQSDGETLDSSDDEEETDSDEYSTDDSYEGDSEEEESEYEESEDSESLVSESESIQTPTPKKKKNQNRNGAPKLMKNKRNGKTHEDDSSDSDPLGDLDLTPINTPQRATTNSSNNKSSKRRVEKTGGKALVLCDSVEASPYQTPQKQQQLENEIENIEQFKGNQTESEEAERGEEVESTPEKRTQQRDAELRNSRQLEKERSVAFVLRNSSDAEIELEITPINSPAKSVEKRGKKKRERREKKENRAELDEDATTMESELNNESEPQGDIDLTPIQTPESNKKKRVRKLRAKQKEEESNKPRAEAKKVLRLEDSSEDENEVKLANKKSIGVPTQREEKVQPDQVATVETQQLNDCEISQVEQQQPDESELPVPKEEQIGDDKNVVDANDELEQFEVHEADYETEQENATESSTTRSKKEPAPSKSKKSVMVPPRTPLLKDQLLNVTNHQNNRPVTNANTNRSLLTPLRPLNLNQSRAFADSNSTSTPVQKPTLSLGNQNAGGLKPLGLSQNLMFAKPLSSKNSALKSTNAPTSTSNSLSLGATSEEVTPSKRDERRKSTVPFVYPTFQATKK